MPSGRFVSATVGLVASLSILLGAVAPAFAASSVGAGNGLKVSPVASNLTIEPGQSQTVQVYVQNVTQTPITLQALINDFVADTDESGAPALLLNGQDAPSHSLKRFIAPVSDISLNPGEEKAIPVVITIPKNTPGGGYYGAVRFTPSVTGGGNSNVSLSASVGSLILVRVPGNIKEQLTLKSFDVRSTVDNIPHVIFTTNQHLVVSERFENTGDVQEQPFGKVVLKQGSTQVASYELNNTSPRGNVLPDSIRNFTISLDKVGAFGSYTVMGNFGYGSNGQLVSAQTTFYVIPLGFILAILAVILIVLFAIFILPKMVKSYNRRVVERATRR